MTSRVRFTPPAKEQFISLVSYIKARNPAMARNFSDKVFLSLESVRNFPQMGRVIPEFPNLTFRELIVEPYRFFYLMQDGVIWVVGAWHFAQCPTEPEGPTKFT